MKQTILNLLRQASGFVSGAQISRQLGVTRTAVWKVIKSLQAEGYVIEAVTNRGYRLSSPADILNEEEIRAILREKPMADYYPHYQFFGVTDSTNQAAKLAALQGLPSGSLFVAERQQAGRGRRGNAWLSDHRGGLWFSLLLRPANAANLPNITLFSGLCIAEALRQDLQLAVGIKWPNDLVSETNGRKICGILTEMIVEERTAVAVIVGIGVNVNTREFPDSIRETATSLYLESGRLFRRADVLAAILRRFADRYPDYLTGSNWLEDYSRYCLTLGRQVRVKPESRDAYFGRAVGLDPVGELIVVDETGQRHTVLSGEVSVRGLLGYHL